MAGHLGCKSFNDEMAFFWDTNGCFMAKIGRAEWLALVGECGFWLLDFLGYKLGSGSFSGRDVGWCIERFVLAGWAQLHALHGQVM
jgi:hypothetical protein